MSGLESAERRTLLQMLVIALTTPLPLMAEEHGDSEGAHDREGGNSRYSLDEAFDRMFSVADVLEGIRDLVEVNRYEFPDPLLDFDRRYLGNENAMSVCGTDLLSRIEEINTLMGVAASTAPRAEHLMEKVNRALNAVEKIASGALNLGDQQGLPKIGIPGLIEADVLRLSITGSVETARWAAYLGTELAEGKGLGAISSSMTREARHLSDQTVDRVQETLEKIQNVTEKAHGFTDHLISPESHSRGAGAIDGRDDRLLP